MRTTFLFFLAVAAVPSSLRATEPRPNIYGCGMTWGNWLGLTGEQAKEWDRRSMDKIVEMGGTNCPADFAWINIETAPGVFDWDYVDHQVDEALARGLEIFAYSGLTPDWALPPGILDQYGSGIGYRFPPDETFIPEFENFFRTLAARYRGRVKHYQFWNEPNGCSWINDGCSNGHMAHTYVPWLIRWYTAMKEGDPDCVLAVGGLDYNSFVTNGWQYIRDIYIHGGGDYFDAVAIHPYGDPLHWQAITDTYQVLLDNGHGHKKLWLNEYGWDTTNEAVKAANLSTVLTELQKPGYHMVFQANYLVITDLPEAPDSGHDYGLCSRVVDTLTITPRQSWYAFRDVDKVWPLAADFHADVTAGPLPLSVQFTDLSYYPEATDWLWEFGDGQTSTEQHPLHVYVQNGVFTVRLTVTGPSGPLVKEAVDLIRAGSVPPVPGVTNPSFEENGGSLSGWEIVQVLGSGPDKPPLSNANSFNVITPHGQYFAGKITNGSRVDFFMGQTVGTNDWSPASTVASWNLNTIVQMHCTHENQPLPAGVHQVWEIGWNHDGSEPAGIMDCDQYQVIADIDGNYTQNSKSFFPLAASGVVENVVGLRGLVIRVRVYNDATWWWTFSNFDAVDFTVTSTPPAIPGDFDGDGDVDFMDVAFFENCATGPGIPLSDPNCASADLDGDDDVDVSDFGILQRCLSGMDQPGDPGCAALGQE
jgi:PKD repeat protein